MYYTIKGMIKNNEFDYIKNSIYKIDKYQNVEDENSKLVNGNPRKSSFCLSHAGKTPI